jgi:molybdopterin-guanine dinucleotide biosynthesis protein A
MSGYVLAGGLSTRMGADKSLLPLAGKPLIEHAVTKLRRICSDVAILSSNPALNAYAPLVPDLHPGCGPLGGIEAALAHSPYDWILTLPVDLPFVPTGLLDRWVRQVTNRHSRRKFRVAMFRVFGRPQPTLLLIHRDAAPLIADAVARREFKLLPALEHVAAQLAQQDAPVYETVPYILPVDEHLRWIGSSEPHPGPQWRVPTPAQLAAQSLWFANLNTPEDFALAQAHLAALDT